MSGAVGRRHVEAWPALATLTGLYPTHDVFVKQFTDAVNALEKQGYLLKPEADAARTAAQDSKVGR